MQFIFGTESIEVFNLRHKRRDANAAGNQHMLVRHFSQCKQIDRMRNFQRHTDTDIFMHIR